MQGVRVKHQVSIKHHGLEVPVLINAPVIRSFMALYPCFTLF